MKVVELAQNTEEWLEFRKNKIGASDAPIIMNASPWTTPYQLWRQKLDLDPPKQENQYMRRGKELESIAREKAEEYFGCDFPSVVAYSLDHEFMCASLDGFNFEKNLPLEIKCPNPEDHELALNGVVPNKYIAQLVHQMMVFKTDRMIYQSYRDEKNYVFLDVNLSQFTEEYRNFLIQKEKDFYKCMLTLTEPELTSKDYVNMEDDPNWRECVSKYVNMKKERQYFEDQEEKYKNELIKMSCNSNCMGFGIKLSKIIRKGNVNYNEIPQLKDVDLELYRKKPIQSYRIFEY